MIPATSHASIERFFQFSLLGLIACAFCALFDTGRLDLLSLAFLLAGLVWRGLMAADLVHLRIPQRLITIVATSYLLFYPLDYYFLSRDFFAATAHGVCFLGVARVLSARTNRDYLYTGCLAFVALLGAAALSTQVRFLGWMGAAIVFGLAALTSAEIRRGYQANNRAPLPSGAPGRTALRLAILVGSAACGILVLTAGLFLIVPRTARAAARLFPGGPRLTGFSDAIDLGGFGAISKDNRPVMRVHSYGPALPPNLKWRGSALSQFDGRHWSEPFRRGQLQDSLDVADLRQRSRRDGDRMLYRVDLASSDTGALFIAGVPEFINLLSGSESQPVRLIRTAEDSFRAEPGLGLPLSYEVSAEIGSPLGYPLSGPERSRNLGLPGRLDRRIPELAKTWSGEGTDLERAERIQARLRRDFTYSLDTGRLSLRDPLADFLFVTRKGYCEYFASAMAVLLRSERIPARVATGFQSGYYNKVSGTWVVRASDAHAWVEAWIEGRGWVTFDPTPAGASTDASAGLLHNLRMYLDAADAAWQEWVVAYNPGQQAALAFGFRNKLAAFLRNGGPNVNLNAGTSLRTTIWILAVVAAAALAFRFRRKGAFAWRRYSDYRRLGRLRRGDATGSDAQFLYERMLSLMARKGFQKPEWFTPLEFARTLPPGDRELIGEFTVAYNEIRFGGGKSGAARLAEMLERLG